MRCFLIPPIISICLSLSVDSCLAFQPISTSTTKTIGAGSSSTSSSEIFFVPTHSLCRPSMIAFSASTNSEEIKEWTKGRIHNTYWFRSSAILLSLFLTSSSSITIPARVSAILHMLSFGTWFGTMSYTTFILGLTMFKNLPRQTFGKLQSKLFPKYFSLCSITIVLQMITLSGLPALQMTNIVKMSLGGALAATFLNQFYLEPTSTKIMLERHQLENSSKEDSSEYQALKKSFGKLHGLSSLFNLLALIGACVYGSVLSKALLVV